MDLYFSDSNSAPFEEVKVPVSNSAEFFPKSATWRILKDFGWLGLIFLYDYMYGQPNVFTWYCSLSYYMHIREN